MDLMILPVLPTAGPIIARPRRGGAVLPRLGNHVDLRRVWLGMAAVLASNAMKMPVKTSVCAVHQPGGGHRGQLDQASRAVSAPVQVEHVH